MVLVLSQSRFLANFHLVLARGRAVRLCHEDQGMQGYD